MKGVEPHHARHDADGVSRPRTPLDPDGAVSLNLGPEALTEIEDKLRGQG